MKSNKISTKEKINMTQAEQKKFVEGFKENKVIIVCRGIAEEEIVNVAEALYEGGVRYMEVPFDQKDVASNVVTARKIKLVSDAMKGRMHVGAGTTCTMDQLRLAIDAGAEIIVAPNMDEEIIVETKKAGLISMPGCMTPSEMVKAYKLGADLIKLFPASVTTLKMIKEVLVPLNNLPLVCFGGVTAENFKDIIDLGVIGVGMAGAILNKEALANKDYAKITELARAVTCQA